MTLRTFVLHLGAHKTGTSLVQKYLRDKEASCRKAKVFAMPRGDGDTFINWGQEHRIDKGAEGLRNQIATAIDGGAECYILSHENSLGRPFSRDFSQLYPHAPARLAHLRSSLGDQPWRVVYYIRNQADFLESYYLQTIHEGKSNTFDNFLSKINIHSLSWRPVYDALCSTFGAENVVLRSFDEDISSGQARFLELFLRSARVPDLTPFNGFQYSPLRNPSIGSRGLELAQKINPMLKDHAERKLFRKFLQDNFSNRDYPRPVLLEPDQKKEVISLYRSENRDIVESARNLAQG